MASAVTPAIEAVLAKISGITPSVDPGTPFRRQSESGTPASTKAGKRLFDFDFDGHGAARPFGFGSRVISTAVRIDYPLGRAEKALEATLAQDSEDLVRALTAPQVWSGGVVKIEVSSTVDRSQREPVLGQGSGFLRLVLELVITYRDP